MRKDQEILLCSYSYDPLDRLVDCGLSTQENTRWFYLKDRLATEIQGAIRHSVFQHDDQLLALRTVENGVVATRVLTTDGQRSVLRGVDASGAHEHLYTPYGHRVASSGLLSLLGFNGERPDPVTGHYLLGNGYRAFNPVLMRFNSPDSWSPFGKGGLNAYAYCAGDPVNYEDRTGRVRGLAALLGLKSSAKGAGAPSSVAANATSQATKAMRNITKLADDAYTFESTHKGQSRLTIYAHGSETHSGKIIVNNSLWGADDIIKNIDLQPYDRIRVLACFSDQLGAELALKTGKEVKAYIGPVFSNNEPSKMSKIFNFYNSTKLKDLGTFDDTLRIRKKNPFNPNTEKAEYLRFNYQAVRFLL